MYRNSENRLNFQYALGTALAASLLAGCAGGNPMAKVHSSSAVAASADYANDKAVAKVEKAVAKQPQDASLRVELASAYLGAGRFESAATTFADAIALGDNSPRTALSLALAYIGTGRNSEATVLLEKWRDSIPASDFGLAIAIAGNSSRGVAILSDEVRSGNEDVKLRQNLAYAYALDGRWLEARLLAAQDLPADQLDARMSSWATQGGPQDYNRRVAGLLGAPVRADSGQPLFLALNRADPEPAPALAVMTESEPAREVDPDRELPPIDEGESFWGTEPKDPAPLLPKVASQAAARPDPDPAGPIDPRPSAGEQISAITRMEPVAESADAKLPARYVSRPVVQPAPAGSRPVAAAVPSSPVKAVRSASGGEAYRVQLGLFASAASADRAIEIYKRRYPSLRQEDMRITQAIVRGKKYWRVAVAGYDRGSARAMCSDVKGSGHGCIAYAEARPLPGALPQRAGSGPMRARR